MNLKDYFEKAEGVGILATSDSNGMVNTAIYSRPHFVDEENCVFLMADKLSHRNLQTNPKAAFAFIQKGAHYQGKRLYLTKIKESDNTALAEEFRRKPHGGKYDTNKKTFVVYFKVDSIRPLVGDNQENIQQKSDCCPNCLQPVGDSGHMCIPKTKKDKTCDWCGSLIADERHLCNDKIKEIAYICNTCGRTAVKAEHLCQPKRIK